MKPSVKVQYAFRESRSQFDKVGTLVDIEVTNLEQNSLDSRE